MLWLTHNLCIARNSIWRRQKKEFFYHYKAHYKDSREHVFNQNVISEYRNFWERDRYLYGKRIKLYTTGYDFLKNVDPLLRRDTKEHMVLNPIFGGDKLDDFFILWENFKPGISKQYDDMESSLDGSIRFLQNLNLLFRTFITLPLFFGLYLYIFPLTN